MQRLKTRSQFQAVLAGGTVARTAHFALHRVALDNGMHELDLRKFDSAPSVALFMLEDVWVGALVPKRWAKRAVTRNAIKRQIYNVSAESAAVFDVAGYVIRLRAAFDRTRFISATSETLKSAVRLASAIVCRSWATFGCS